MVVAVRFFDVIRIDDPVGATSVHLACGVLGTLLVGLFSDAGISAANGVTGADGLFNGGGWALLGTQALVRPLSRRFRVCGGDAHVAAH